MDFILVLVRHGETDHNKESVIQGQLDIPLSNNGVNQAKLLGQKLNGEVWKEVWTSDLKRAWQTANFVLYGSNLSEIKNNETLLSQPSSNIQTDFRIRERNYGIAQGKSLASLKMMANEAGVAISQFVPPEAETPDEMKKRGISFFQDMCKKQFVDNELNSSVLVVGHGGWLREFITHISLNFENVVISLSDMKKVGNICPNTGVSRFQISLGASGTLTQIKCLSLHDQSHLNNSILCDDLTV